jgi:hypothetical protein
MTEVLCGFTVCSEAGVEACVVVLLISNVSPLIVGFFYDGVHITYRWAVHNIY